MNEEYFRPEITFEDLEIGDVFIFLNDKIDNDGLYMKIHVFDFAVYPYPSNDTNWCLNLLSGNAFRVDSKTEVQKLKKQN